MKIGLIIKFSSVKVPDKNFFKQEADGFFFFFFFKETQKSSIGHFWNEYFVYHQKIKYSEIFQENYDTKTNISGISLCWLIKRIYLIFFSSLKYFLPIIPFIAWKWKIILFWQKWLSNFVPFCGKQFFSEHYFRFSYTLMYF